MGCKTRNIADDGKEIDKNEKCTCRACKAIAFVCQICKLFSLLKLPNRGFARQPCCMAGTMKMFCIRKNIRTHGKKNLLFLPCNMAAVQNLCSLGDHDSYENITLKYYLPLLQQFHGYSKSFDMESVYKHS